jgi:hypothetical protein
VSIVLADDEELDEFDDSDASKSKRSTGEGGSKPIDPTQLLCLQSKQELCVGTQVTIASGVKMSRKIRQDQTSSQWEGLVELQDARKNAKGSR